MYNPKLISRMIIVLKRTCGMNPPTRPAPASRETCRGATASSQYGQTRSLIVINARQCGHIRRDSMYFHHPRPRLPAAKWSATIGLPAMVKTEREYREDICQIGRLVFQKGWVAANDGNITIRLDAERILATPPGVSKGMMQPDDLIVVDLKGNKISGRANCTSEIAMHTTVYGLRPDIKAVVHAHPPVATGFATAGRQLNLALLPEVIIGLGCVPMADYGLPEIGRASCRERV